MNRKLLASFLSGILIFSGMQPFGLTACAGSTSLSNVRQAVKKLSTYDEAFIGGGIGVSVLAAIGIPIIVHYACGEQTLTLKEQTQRAFSNKDGIIDPLFSGMLPKNRDSLTACYYGADSFVNCARDIGASSIENSTCLIHFDYSVDTFNDGDSDYTNVRRFVQYNGCMWQVVKGSEYINDWDFDVKDGDEQYYYLKGFNNNYNSCYMFRVDRETGEVAAKLSAWVLWEPIEYDCSSDTWNKTDCALCSDVVTV